MSLVGKLSVLQNIIVKKLVGLPYGYLALSLAGHCSKGSDVVPHARGLRRDGHTPHHRQGRVAANYRELRDLVLPLA